MCLQFKQEMGAQQPLKPSPAATAAAVDHDDEDPSVPWSTPEPAHPLPARPTASSSSTPPAAVPSISGVSKSKKKGRSPGPGDPDIVQLILQHQERSQAAAGELRQLVTQAAGPVNNKSAWG